jgi:uncharacterized protein YjiS (DUF1127 family)
MTQAIETRLFSRIRPFAILRTLYANWRKRGRLRGLEHLNDHMLEDIGLTRADVAAALGQPMTVDPVRDLERRAMRRRNQSMNQATTRWLNDRAFVHPKLPCNH